MKKYSENETLKELGKSMSPIENLYKVECINWKGKTDSNVLYSEIIAQELLRNLSEFDKIPKITRKNTYCRDTHPTIHIDLGNSNRREDIFAKRIYDLEFDELGKVIDYQVPLRDTINDKGIKAFDLLSYCKEKSLLYIVELKYIDNSETLLRAILECYTYFKLVDHEKLISDYEKITLRNDLEIQPALLLVNSKNNSCAPYKELEDLYNRPMLKALSLVLKVKFFSCQLNDIIIAEDTF